MIEPRALAHLVQAIQGRLDLRTLSTSDWENVIRLARISGLAGRLAHIAGESLAAGALPDGAKRYISAWSVITEKLEADLIYELEEIRAALSGIKVQPVLLKGAAYNASRAPWAAGRHYSDIDLMVPFETLPFVERALLIRGWQPSHRDDAYTHKYYREWMHEIPPLSHVHRGTTIDLHHAITPRVSRISSDGEALIANAEPITNAPGFQKLSDVDQLIHCATHIFSDTEIPKGLRDLLDFDALLTQCNAHEDNGAKAVATRAEALGLERMLYHAWRQAHRLIGTPPPPACIAGFSPSKIGQFFIDSLYARALAPDHVLSNRPGSSLARTAVLVRGHWLRMPLPLLASHLGHKLIHSVFAKDPDEKKADPQG